MSLHRALAVFVSWIVNIAAMQAGRSNESETGQKRKGDVARRSCEGGEGVGRGCGFREHAIQRSYFLVPFMRNRRVVDIVRDLPPSAVEGAQGLGRVNGPPCLGVLRFLLGSRSKGTHGDAFYGAHAKLSGCAPI